MRRHRQSLTLMTEMNVTNLLDTAFVLLMAFMIVAPAIKHGIELDLPNVTAQNIDGTKTMTVVIKPSDLADGSPDWVYIDDRRLTIDELRAECLRKKGIFPEMDVTLEADKDVTWDSVARVLATIKSVGIENVGLMTEPER